MDADRLAAIRARCEAAAEACRADERGETSARERLLTLAVTLLSDVPDLLAALEASRAEAERLGAKVLEADNLLVQACLTSDPDESYRLTRQVHRVLRVAHREALSSSGGAGGDRCSACGHATDGPPGTGCTEEIAPGTFCGCPATGGADGAGEQGEGDQA